MTKDDIKNLALANGFKLKVQPDGSEDLNPYVYDFAKALSDSYMAKAIGELKERLALGPNDEAGIGAYDVLDQLIEATRE